MRASMESSDSKSKELRRKMWGVARTKLVHNYSVRMKRATDASLRGSPTANFTSTVINSFKKSITETTLGRLCNVNGMYEVFARFENLIEKGEFCDWAVSMPNVIERL